MNKLFASRLVPIYIQITVLLVLSIAFSVIVIQDFSMPLIGSGDVSSWEYIGFYFTHNLKFNFFPQLDLILLPLWSNSIITN